MAAPDICPNCGKPVETHEMFDPPRCPVVRLRWPLDAEEPGAIESSAAPIRERTLILEIALPDFHCEDYRLDGADPYMNEALAEAASFDPDGATPEWLGWQALDDAGLTTHRINLSILVGGKDGNFLERVKGQLVGQRIVERKPEHELSDDDRLDFYEERDRDE